MSASRNHLIQSTSNPQNTAKNENQLRDVEMLYTAISVWYMALIRYLMLAYEQP